MINKEIILIGNYLVKSLQSNTITPLDFFDKISELLPGDSKEISASFMELWDKNSDHIKESGGSVVEVNQPLLLTRGYNNELVPENQLLSFLPEEKILINKDIFREHLKNRDLVKIDSRSEKALMDILNKESIGLSSNDVLLYYNLLKINQISSNDEPGSKESMSPDEFAIEIHKLSVNVFNLTTQSIKKINGGKDIEEGELLNLITENIKSKKINPEVLSLCLGHRNSKFIELFTGFITQFISQRGDDPQDILVYLGLYILLNGSHSSKLKKLNLASHVEAFVIDRIGRIRSIYYVAFLFIHTFNVILAAQVYEISVKYLDSSREQGIKLQKLYSADNRRSILISNAINIATDKVSKYKNESIEVINTFKRYIKNRKDIVSTVDLFNIDYRVW